MLSRARGKIMVVRVLFFEMCAKICNLCVHFQCSRGGAFFLRIMAIVMRDMSEYCHYDYDKKRYH